MNLINHIKNQAIYFLSTFLRKVKNLLRFIYRIALNQWTLTSLVCICFIAGSIYLSYFSEFEPLQYNAMNFFIAIGSIFGGMLAIIFPIITLLMQNAAKVTSAGFYDILAKSIWMNLYFILLGIFTGSSLILATIASENSESIFDSLFNVGKKSFIELNASHIFFISLIAIGIAFIGLFLITLHIYKRINPNKNINFILNDIKKTIRKRNRLMTYFLKSHSRAILAKKNGLHWNDMDKVEKFNSSIKNRIDHLFDYHEKLLTNKEKHTSRIVLRAIKEILVYNFDTLYENEDLRSKIPQLYDKIYSYTLEELLHKADHYIEINDSGLIIDLVNIFAELIVVGTKYKSPIAVTFLKTPLAQGALNYFQIFTKKCIEKNNLEGLFQVASIYGKMGIKFIEEEDFQSFLSSSENLISVAEKSLLIGYHVVYQEVIKSYMILFRNLVNAGDEQSFAWNLKQLLKQIRLVVLIGVKNFKRTHPLFLEQHVGQIYFFSGHTINEKAILIQGIKDQEQKNKAMESLIDIVENTFNELLEALIVELNSNSLLVVDISSHIQGVSWTLFKLIENPENEPFREKLLLLIRHYTEVTKWFIGNESLMKEDSILVDQLMDIITKIGLHAIEIGERDLGQECVEIINEFAYKMLTKQKSSFGLTEPRIFVKSLYIGILSNKISPGKENDNLAEKLKINLEIFNEEYKIQHFPHPDSLKVLSPKPEQVMIELDKIKYIDLENDIGENWQNYESEVMLLKKIDITDVDDFLGKII